MSARFKVRCQRPIKGGRRQKSASLEQQIVDEILRLSRRFGCSQSWVIKTALADAMGIDVDERYDNERAFKQKIEEHRQRFAKRSQLRRVG